IAHCKFGGFPIEESEYSNPDNDPRGKWKPVPLDANKPGGKTKYGITNPNNKKEFFPPNGRSWAINKEVFEKLLENNRISFGTTGESAPKRKLFYNERIEKGDRKTPISIWYNSETTKNGTKQIMDLFGEKKFSYPKPVGLIRDIIYISSLENDFISLDFFAGSGTTGHAILKLNKEDDGNRKFILVEMGSYFETVTKPRILKVIYSDNWKNGVPQDNKGSKKQIIKYQNLEQYEDSLNNIEFKEPNTLAKESKDYKVKYMLGYESKENNVFLNLDALDNPFNYKLKIETNNEFKEQSIDLVETFNYIAGIEVKSIKKLNDKKVQYVVVKGKKQDKEVIVIWRNKDEGFTPEKDKEFINKEILKEDYDEILVNGNSLIDNAKSIDEIFKSNMFRG
ncbi:MAG: site-specific DNA-methyltransferase, partial [Nanoarchaeota archaeon]|nr:site-specific DNA-methyltransferase [Nanoarchaeota archaeon]